MQSSKNNEHLDVDNGAQYESESDIGELGVLPTKDEQSGPVGKALSFNHPDSFHLSRDMIIQDGPTAIYYGEVSEFRRRKPDITLHRGGDKEGSIVAASFYGFGKFRLGVGSDEISMVWTECKRGGSILSKHFLFEWNGKTYSLQRAKSKDTNVTGFAKLMLTHFKVVEADTGELIALYTSNKFGRKKGTVKLKPDLPEDLEILSVLCIASWRDKIRRQQPKGGGGG